MKKKWNGKVDFDPLIEADKKADFAELNTLVMDVLDSYIKERSGLIARRIAFYEPQYQVKKQAQREAANQLIRVINGYDLPESLTAHREIIANDPTLKQIHQYGTT